MHWSIKILIPNRIKKIGTIDSNQQNKIMYLHTLVATSPNVVQYIFSATDCQAPSNPGWAWSQLTSNVLTVQDRMKYERYVLALTFRPWGSGYKRERELQNKDLKTSFRRSCGGALWVVRSCNEEVHHMKYTFVLHIYIFHGK